MTRRLGTPSTEREGVALELTNAGRRIALRGWHSGELVIRPHFFSIEEFCHALGLVVPPRAPRKTGPRSLLGARKAAG